MREEGKGGSAMKRNQWKQENIRLGTHGEDYGSWMSNPVFYIIGGIGVLAAVLAVLSFYVFHVDVLGVLIWIGLFGLFWNADRTV